MCVCFALFLFGSCRFVFDFLCVLFRFVLFCLFRSLFFNFGLFCLGLIFCFFVWVCLFDCLVLFCFVSFCFLFDCLFLSFGLVLFCFVCFFPKAAAQGSFEKSVVIKHCHQTLPKVLLK